MLLVCICDALSHSDDVTSFQGVVQHKQAWPDLSQLRSCGQFSVKGDWTRAFLRSRADLGAQSMCGALKWVTVRFKDGSSLYMRHLNGEPVLGGSPRSRSLLHSEGS